MLGGGGGAVKKSEPSGAIGGNVNWYNHMENSMEISLKTRGKNYRITQQGHYWIYILRKSQF